MTAGTKRHGNAYDFAKGVPMSTDAQPIGPVSAAERIFYIDLLRGMALFWNPCREHARF